jgi:K+ transporter
VTSHRGRSVARGALIVGALGVVFGDIGTSPIYTVRTVFNPSDPYPVTATTESVFGIISLIFWSVTIIVTVTYVLIDLLFLGANLTKFVHGAWLPLLIAVTAFTVLARRPSHEAADERQQCDEHHGGDEEGAERRRVHASVPAPGGATRRGASDPASASTAGIGT